MCFHYSLETWVKIFFLIFCFLYKKHHKKRMVSKYILNYTSQLCITQYTAWCALLPFLFLNILKHTSLLHQIQLLYEEKTFLPGFSGFILISNVTHSFFLSFKQKPDSDLLHLQITMKFYIIDIIPLDFTVRSLCTL